MPAVAADTPVWQQKPAIWNKTGLIVRPVNVFKLTDGTYTEVQPITNDPLGGWETVAICYYGGHSYTVSASEAAALTAAGYGPYLS